MVNHNTWICVADGARARFFHCDGPGRDIEPALNYVLAAPARAHNASMTTDRPGRTFDSAGWGRHSYDEGDWQDAEKSRFAGRVAALLDKAASEHRFDRLVMVAPPAMMGELRKHMSDICSHMEVVEVLKDLTHATPREMQCHLTEALPH